MTDTTSDNLLSRLGSGTGMYQPQLDGSADAQAPRPRQDERVIMVRPATEKQTAFIRRLLAERTGVEAVEPIRQRLNEWRDSDQGVTAAGASKAIDELLAIEAPERKAVETGPSLRRNRYAGACNLCGRNVEEGDGLIDKNDEGKWVVWHETCPSDFPFPEGRYAVENEEGELRFYHLVNAQVFVMASDAEHLLPSRASADAVVAKIALDPEAAAAAYGRELEHCGLCNRALTNKASRDRGIGPVCAQKAGW